jgi:hypothetical protein
VFHHRVHGNNRHRVRQNNSLAFQAPAIDQQRGVSLSEDCGVLIHDSRRQPDKIVFSALGQLRKFDAWQIARPTQRERRGHFQCSRGTEAGAQRHAAVDQYVAPPSERQLPRDADHVITPIADGAELGDLLDRPLAALIQIFRMDAQDSQTIRRRRNVAIQIDGHRQYQAEIVIGVLTDEVHASGSAGEIRRAVVARLKSLDYELRRASHSIRPPNARIETPQ